MKKSNLRAGMLIETRAGKQYFLLPYNGKSDTLYAYDLEKVTSKTNTDIWCENLIHKYKDADMDIVKVFYVESFNQILDSESSPTFNLLWTRPSEAELMECLAEIVLQLQEVLTLF